MPTIRLRGLLRARARWPLAALAAVGLAITTAACASSQSSTSATPVSGGVLTYAADQLPDCLDPGYSSLDIVGSVDRNIFDSLVSQSDDGTFHPWLATKWTISPDGKTYTFYLRSGVKFQDGTALNAQAVAASLAHVVAKSTDSSYAASLLGPFTGTTVVNASTIEIHLSQPFSPLLQALSEPYLGIQSAKALSDDTEAELCAHPVGSGPFTFVNWTKPTSLTLTKFAAYDWGPPTASHTGAAYLSGLEYVFNTEDASRFGSLTSGQDDVIEDVPPVDVSALKAQSGLGLIDRQDPGGVYLIGLDTTSGPLTDLRVRQALLDSLNLTQLVNSVYFGQYARAWSPLSPTTPDYDASLQNSSSYSVAEANKLLDEAGWTGRNAAGYRTKDGKALVLYWPAANTRQDRTDIGEGIQAEAKAVGIDVDYANVSEGTYIQAMISQSANLVAASFVRDDPDILRHFWDKNSTIELGGANIWDLNVADLNTWLEGGASSTDAAQQATDYKNVQEYVVKNVIAIPVYVPTTLDGYQSKVHGLTTSADGTTAFYDAWIAK